MAAWLSACGPVEPVANFSSRQPLAERILPQQAQKKTPSFDVRLDSSLQKKGFTYSLVKDSLSGDYKIQLHAPIGSRVKVAYRTENGSQDSTFSGRTIRLLRPGTTIVISETPGEKTRAATDSSSMRTYGKKNNLETSPAITSKVKKADRAKISISQTAAKYDSSKAAKPEEDEKNAALPALPSIDSTNVSKPADTLQTSISKPNTSKPSAIVANQADSAKTASSSASSSSDSTNVAKPNEEKSQIVQGSSAETKKPEQEIPAKQDAVEPPKKTKRPENVLHIPIGI